MGMIAQRCVALQVLKSKERPLVSSVFFMCLPDKVFLLILHFSSQDLHTSFGFLPIALVATFNLTAQQLGFRV